MPKSQVNPNKHRFLNSFMRQEQAKAEALFASIGDGAIVTDALGRISRINPIAAQLLGYKEAELIGKWFPGTIVAEDRDGNLLTNLERPIVRVFMTGEAVSARVYYRRKNGAQMPVFLTVSPVILGGKPVGAIEVFRDISHELRLEQAKDDFISIASHQLRTPATGVKQYVGMVLEGYVGDVSDKQHTLLTKAYESNERQLQIIDDLLRVARIDAGNISLQLAKVDLVQLLQDIMYEQINKIKGRQQRIRFSHSVDSLGIMVDPSRLRMVFENLIDNASKYTPEGKTIRVRLLSKSRSVTIEIEDEGIGISKKDVPKLFRKFTRLDKDTLLSAEGSGLGLYWARRIIDLHGGSITVKSQPDKGSIFAVRLPLVTRGLRHKAS